MSNSTEKMSFFIFVILLSVSSTVFARSFYETDDDDADSETSMVEMAQNKSHTIDTDPRVLDYADNAKVKKMINHAVANYVAKGRANSVGKCNLYVAQAVAAAGMPRWSGQNAYYAVQVKDVAVNSLGYINLLDDYPNATPKDAPVGSILVYSTTSLKCSIPKSNPPMGCGHVEIKTKTDYVSDYIDSVPVNEGGNTFTLTAILVLPKFQL